MSDPLLLALGNISLSTTLRAMTEMADTIEETFAKDAQNLKEIHVETIQISKTVRELAKLCNEPSGPLAEAKEMNVGLLELMLYMKLACHRCHQMLSLAPDVSSGTPKPHPDVWETTLDRIYLEIKELRYRVTKCYSRCLMFPVMELEKLSVVTTGRSSTALVRHNSKEISTQRWPHDDWLIAFVGSHDSILSKLPLEITTNFVADTYLRFQIDAIDDYLMELSSANSYPIEEPIEDYLRPYQPVVNAGPSADREAFRQDIIAKTLEIQSCLRTDSSTLSIQEGAWNLVNLSVGLHSLEMYEEATSMGIWTVNLFRTLTKTNPAVYSPYLVHALRLLSRFYISVNNNKDAKITIVEAISISRGLQSRFADREIKFQLGEALITLANVLDLDDDGVASLEAAQEGVRIYENEFITQRFPQNNYNPGYQVVSRSRYQWAQILEGFPEKAVSDYSRALDQLSFSLQKVEQLEAAVGACVMAVDILVNSDYTLRTSMQANIAGLFYRLSHQQFHSVIKLEQSLVYAQQSVDIYRTLCQQDRDGYVASFCHALYEKANILAKLEKYDEALVIWQEISELAQDIADEQVFRADALNEMSWSYRKLERHDEAATIRTESVTVYQTALDTTSDKAAHGYFDLGVDLRLAGRFSEAIEALQKALTKYRALAFTDPDRYTKSVANTLNQLTLNLIHSNRHDEALNDGYESLQLHTALIEKDPTIVSQYIFALQLNFDIAQFMENESKCIERARYNIACAKTLVEKSPEEGRALFIQAGLCQAYVFSRFERLSEASTTIDEVLNWIDCNSLQNSKEVQMHMHSLIQACNIAFNQGLTQRPLDLIEKTIEIGKSHSSEPLVADLLTGAMYRRAQVLGLMGRYVDAKDASVESQTLARQNAEDGVIDFIGCLRVCCISFRDTGESAQAITYIEEALKLCHSDEFKKAVKTSSFAYVFEIDCLCCFSDVLADVGQETEALASANKALNGALELKDKYPTLPWSEIESSYIDALHTLAERLAANNELSRACDMMIEVRSYYEKLLEGRKGLSLSLARSLFSEGIICCAAGRHAEGVAARTKQLELQRRLELELPELVTQVRLMLSKIQTYPAITTLLAQLNLSCSHQRETHA